MKKMVLFFALLAGLLGLMVTACAGAGPAASGASSQEAAAIVLEMDENYDETDPFVNEKLFCVSEDLDTLTAAGTLDLQGGKASLEVKNNRTGEVLWSRTWDADAEKESFTISLSGLKQEDEYVLCLTGTGIRRAAAEVTFDSSAVQEREKPLR